MGARIGLILLLLTVSPTGFAQSGKLSLPNLGVVSPASASRTQAQMLSAYSSRLQLSGASRPSARPDPVLTMGLSVAGLSGLAMAHTKGRHDKIDHIMAGYLVGLATSGIYTLYTKEPDSRRSRAIAFLLGVAASAAVGALKEEYDGHSGTGQVDDVDIYATIGGGVGGAFTIGLIDWLFL